MMKFFRLKHFAHLCMIAFAGASLFNLQAYLIAVDKNKFLSWFLAVALSGVLVIMAGLLSEMQWKIKDAKFLTILVVTTGLTIVSGSIQGASYAQHSWWLPGYALGFALPGLGELGLALAISAYTQSMNGREVGEAQKELAAGVRRTLVEAIANVDKRLIEAQVNKAMLTVTRELVSSVAEDMVQELRSNRPAVVAQIAETETPEIAKSENLQLEIRENPQILHAAPDPIARMHAAKQDKIAKRRDAILQLTSGSGMSIEDLAAAVDCSTRTIRMDLDKLKADGHALNINGVVKSH